MNKTRLKCFKKKITIKKHIIKIIIIIITFTLVSYNKILFLNKQPPQSEQPTFIARQSDIPTNLLALNRLAKQTVVEIMSEGYLTGGDPYITKGSGVIIGRKDSVYYVLTANHLSNIDDGLLVFTRSEKPGEAGEVALPLKFIKRYPREDLAVVEFSSFIDYKVAKVGEASQLDDDNQVYVAGWPGAENREGFQFTPAKVTNPQVGDNLTYQPTEPGEDVYKGMSGGAVLNEAGQLVGIHVGLTKIDGDGKGVLISTFLRMVPPEVEEVLVRSTPDVLSSSSSENEKVKLGQKLDSERRKREEAEGRVQELEVERKKQEELRTKQEQLQKQLEEEKREKQRVQKLEVKRKKQQKKHNKWIAKESQLQRQLEKEKRHRWKTELRERELVGGVWTFGLSGWIYHQMSWLSYRFQVASAELQVEQAKRNAAELDATLLGFWAVVGFFSAWLKWLGWLFVYMLVIVFVLLMAIYFLLLWVLPFMFLFNNENEFRYDKLSGCLVFYLLWGWIWFGLIASVAWSVAFCFLWCVAWLWRLRS
jgi:hypothetical protein